MARTLRSARHGCSSGVDGATNAAECDPRQRPVLADVWVTWVWTSVFCGMTGTTIHATKHLSRNGRCVSTSPTPIPRRGVFRRRGPGVRDGGDAEGARMFPPGAGNDGYQRRIQESRRVPGTSMAAAPLVSGDVTSGVLGFVEYGGREWARR